MQDELFLNTPESLGVTPRYVLQHGVISRSAHNLSATAEKLTVMAMALLPPGLSNLTASFTFTDFRKAFGYGKSGKRFTLFKEAVGECGRCVIAIETERGWEKFEWFATAAFNEKTGRVAMTLSPDFASALRDSKRFYTKLNLLDIGKLRSRYGLRYYGLAKSYESLAGKDGNRQGAWYFERPIEELRRLLGIDPDAYPETRDFKKKVIEEPIKELNGVGLGIEIRTEGIKQRRVLKSIRFNCVKVARTTAANSPLPEPNPKTAGNRVEKELQHLQELYPDEFAELYEKALEEVPTLGGHAEGFRMIAAMGKALALLRMRHGIVK